MYIGRLGSESQRQQNKSDVSRKFSKAAIGHVRYACGVAVKVSACCNSILCTACGKCIHERYNGVKGSLGKVQAFECRYSRSALLGKMN